MRRSPSIVPDVADRGIYLVLDDFGRLGRSWREIDEERTDRETIITDLRAGQYSNPVLVIAINTAESWSRDVSEEMADEIARRCSMDGFDVPPFLQDFVDRHGSGRPAQLPLPLRRAG
jgi:hypothetical protein